MADPKTAKAVSTMQPANAPPAHLVSAAKADAGKGVSTAAEDNIVPLIFVLQPTSKALKRSMPEYIEGAMSGDIVLKNFPGVIKGDVGILFQPCHFDKGWVERTPQDKGRAFVRQYRDLPKEVQEKHDPQNPIKVEYWLPNGNEVVETRYHAGIVHFDDGSRMPYVIPMSSTGHTVSKNWMTVMGNKLVEGQKAPSFACLYRMKTREKTNPSGTWSLWDIQDAGWVMEKADYDMGKALFEAMESGAKVAEAGTEEEATSTDGKM